MNPSGEPPLRRTGEMEDYFGAAVDMVITGSADETGVASTIVDFTGDEAAVIRKGTYPWHAG